MSWTRRFALAIGLCVWLFMISTGWLGLLPGTAANLLVDGALVALIGLYAVRVGALGLGAGLFLTILALDANRATLTLGLSPLPDDRAGNYWLSSTLPAAAVWFAFPVLARALSRYLPPLLGGLGIGLALLPLPALRLFDRGDAIVDAYLHPQAGNFVLLPVPWLPLVALASVLATLALLVIQRPRTRRAPQLAVAALVAITVVLPTLQTVVNERELRGGVQVQPAAGGPLTPVSIRARADADAPAQLRWDDKPMVSSALQPLRVLNQRGLAQAQFLPGLQGLEVGTHQIQLRIADDRRHADFEVFPASGLGISIDRGHVTVVGGSPRAQVDILTVGPSGAELLHRQFDEAGRWRSPLALPAGVAVRIIAQSGDAWVELRLP